ELAIVSATGNHFGNVQNVGSIFNAAALDSALAIAAVSGANALPAVLGLVGTAAALYHPPSTYATDLISAGIISSDPTSPTQTQSNSTLSIVPNLSFIVANTSQTSTPAPTNSHPVVTSPSGITAITNQSIPLSNIFVGSELPSGSGHHIVHYEAFIVRGPG